jgi:hypothetical protein
MSSVINVMWLYRDGILEKRQTDITRDFVSDTQYKITSISL